MMLGLAMDRLYKFFAPALHKGLPQSEAPVFEGVFLLHQECDWLAQSLDACRTRAYEVGRVKIRVPHYEERPGAAHSRRDQDCDASEVHKIEDEAQVLVVGHKPAMEVCEEQLSTRCQALRSGRTGIAVSCTTEAFEWEELQRRSEPDGYHTG